MLILYVYQILQIPPLEQFAILRISYQKTNSCSRQNKGHTRSNTQNKISLVYHHKIILNRCVYNHKKLRKSIFNGKLPFLSLRNTGIEYKTQEFWQEEVFLKHLRHLLWTLSPYDTLVPLFCYCFKENYKDNKVGIYKATVSFV